MLDTLKELRAERGITQQQLGDAVGVTQQAINSYENSDTKPEFSVLFKLADYFNVSLDYLLRRRASSFLNDEAIKYTAEKDDAELITKYLSLSRPQKKVVSELIDMIIEPGKFQ